MIANNVDNGRNNKSSYACMLNDNRMTMTYDGGWCSIILFTRVLEGSTMAIYVARRLI